MNTREQDMYFASLKKIKEQDKQIKALNIVIQSQQATIVELQKQVKDLHNERR